jgi:transcriptional regulator with GAF, ATPase, and Fis domain
MDITELREKTDQLRDLNKRLSEEKLYLEDELGAEYNFGEIVGSSEALKRALARVKTVAVTDSTVLILGETGTGKELVARAIHSMSSRSQNSFIKINCAAVPTGLLESELFGYERGAFTHATSQKLGRMELAHKGTFFMDEVGDIPLEVQPKLLRALEDQEFERLGSSRTIQVDVRMIAATNHDLLARVSEREFREAIGSMYSLSACRLYVTGAKTFRCWFATSFPDTPPALERPLKIFPAAPCRRSPGGIGRATCVNSKTSSSAR